MLEHDKKIVDVSITEHGSLFLFRPLTQVAKDWIDENVSDESQWFGDALVVEPRFAGNLAHGMIEAGLEVE